MTKWVSGDGIEQKVDSGVVVSNLKATISRKITTSTPNRWDWVTSIETDIYDVYFINL